MRSLEGGPPDGHGVSGRCKLSRSSVSIWGSVLELEEEPFSCAVPSKTMPAFSAHSLMTKRPATAVASVAGGVAAAGPPPCTVELGADAEGGPCGGG